MKKLLALVFLGYIFTLNAQENIKSRKIETKFSEGWDTTPALGITKGEYYSEELKFGRGEQHLGILEVVINSGKIVMVEFNEIGRSDYHTVAYQNQLKRNSEYNFMMGEIGGSTWIQGVLLAEKQVLEKQDLLTKLDYVAGATETVVQGFEPLAKIVNDRIKKGTNQKFYRISEDLGGGMTGVLDVVLENGKIINCMYDEIFANSKDKIENPKLKKYYRVSKYESILYKEDSKVGFRYQMNKLNERVVETQDLLNIKGLPAAERTKDYLKNPSYDNYIKLAKKLSEELKKDNILKN
ncbi:MULTISPECIES: FMN-binding protein [Bacteria]|uniref:FMN-binding protein n=1 Tax=Bacteria TaxID=2 RepID=UPI003EE5F5F7